MTTGDKIAALGAIIETAYCAYGAHVRATLEAEAKSLDEFNRRLGGRFGDLFAWLAARVDGATVPVPMDLFGGRNGHTGFMSADPEPFFGACNKRHQRRGVPCCKGG